MTTEQAFMAPKNVLKVAHMSDLHYCAENLIESDRTFGFSVDDAINRNCAAAVVTGDSTDHSLDAHAPSLHALARQLKRLADHCPVLMLQGTFSHEPVGLLQMFAMIGAKYPICVADKIGAYGLTLHGFESFATGTDYTMVVTAFPTVNKAELMATATSKEAGVEMGDLLFQMMCEFGIMNAALRARGIPTMLIGHGTVANCLTEHGVPMAGQDHEFGVGALFAAQTDAVALGHIHKHQSWEKSENGYIQRTAYAGSIGRFHYGEEGDKHYLLWSMKSGDSPFEAIVTPSRRTIDLFFSGPPDMDAIRKAAPDCIGAFVRVRYCVDEEHKQSVDRAAIKAALSMAIDVQIEGKTLVIERQRAAGISTVSSMDGKLQKWCVLTQTPAAPLQQCLADLQTKDAGTISTIILERIYASKTRKSDAPGSASGDGSNTSAGIPKPTVAHGETDQAFERANESSASATGVDERVSSELSLFA